MGRSCICSWDPLPVFETRKFYGCDGKPWSDEFLQEHIDDAVKEENYEWAAECKAELDRRKKATNG